VKEEIMSAHAVVRRRLEDQGFHLDDAALVEIGPWLRWSPALCAAFIATGTILASPPVLWTVAAIGLLGAALPFHPFDLLYDHGARHLTGTRPLPHHGAQRRFACGVAAAWLTATGLAFQQGAPVLGYVLGGAMTLAAATVATTHLCVASAVYNKLFRPRATVTAPVARRA
jgi:hypothetical protein